MRNFLVFVLVLASQAAWSSHLRGGQLTARLIDCRNNTYEITLTLYLNTGSLAQPGDGVLSFGDGSSISTSGFLITTIDQLNGVASGVYKTIYSYKSEGPITISYLERNRNNGVLNYQNNVNTPFYIESFLLINQARCNTPLDFTIPPIDRACSKLIFTHNPGAIAPLDDSLSYQLVNPLQGKDVQVSSYKTPNSIDFYSTNYQSANELGNGPPTYSIDSDGTLQWDAPGINGEFATAIKVFHWAKVNGKWTVVDWVIRDMQIIVADCMASRPTFNLADQCFIAGDNFKQTIKVTDKVSNSIKVEVFTTDNFYSSPPKFINLNKFQSTTPPNDTANIKISWSVGCDIVRAASYRIIFKISSFTPSGIRISTFKVWNVKVSGPPPTYKSLSLDVAKKILAISWNSYSCSNSSPMEIWRRVDKTSTLSDRCIQSIPLSFGYAKIGETTNGVFLDKDISAGATYCYRLVANFSQSYSGKSLASKDTCIGPIRIDAPVLTNVTVQSTNEAAGKILVKWLSPFQINKALFPKPYEYDILRTLDGKFYTKINTIRLRDTTYTDLNLNTRDSNYGYKIVLYSPNSIAQSNPIDTSSIAFYPRLSFKSLEGAIQLAWKAQTPWSNRSFRFPFHYIYRKSTDDLPFQRMDSVDSRLLESVDFEYVDDGKKVGFPINSNFVYQYKIETKGSYGNPLIKEPLRNFSNEIVAQPIDKVPPCAPILKVVGLDCENLKSLDCSVDVYKNTLSWDSSNECGNDIASYEVYYFENEKSDSVLLTKTWSRFYEDRKEYTQAGCYKVLAIDRSGNVGLPSDFICIENCLNPFIPNVITANTDGYNEKFPGFSDRSDKRDPVGCPRFIEKFSMTIINRWGDQVFQVNGSSPRMDSEWKGLDDNGKELPAGTYYYSTDITFYSANPQAKTKNVKGWVQLIR
jgi:CHU_C Type IX secretion signal domain